MPTTYATTGQTGVTAADVDAKLRKGVFVKRGDIVAAFGLTRSDMEALVPEVFRPVASGRFKRARFLRSQVMDIARTWERDHGARA